MTFAFTSVGTDAVVVACADPADDAGDGSRGAIGFARWATGREAALWDDAPLVEADLIVVPWVAVARGGEPWLAVEAFEALVRAIPSYRSRPERHVFLDNSDLDAWAPRPAGYLFKTSIGMRARNTWALPYNTYDPGPVSPIAEAECDVGFQGCVDTHPIRQAMNLWRHGWTDFSIDFRVTPPFWTQAATERAALRRSYSACLNRCRFQLCPRGRGLNSRRFYETLAHGRIPVLFSDAARLPLEDRIPWDRCVVRVPEGFGKYADHYVRAFLERTTSEAASALAREVWTHYLRPGQLRRLVIASLQDSRALPARGGPPARPGSG